MCGICGVVAPGRKEEAESLVCGMLGALRHRGPDDEGMLSAPPVALGVRRLSIIDLEGGHQPIYNEDGTLAVVLNGEIYNFIELRRELESRGHKFRTRSDTEVVVHAYETWGVDCVHHLRGMFAFAVLELHSEKPSEPRRLFLARDRLGIKPLYYSWQGDRLAFASEARALLKGGVTPRLSLAGLESFLLFGSVAEPMTLLEGIYSLPPGHRALIPLTGRERTMHIEPYWDMAAFPENGRSSAIEPAKAREELRELLEELVRLHLRADVPTGVFLSSGIDSTALAALANRVQAGLHTFTVGFPEQDYSEATLAGQTARQLGTVHHEILLRGEDMLPRLGEAVAALDQPTLDGVNTYFVSKAARQEGLKVAFSGLGGDEIFGGYPAFHWTPYLKRFSAVGNRLGAPFRAATGAVWESLGNAMGAGATGDKLASLWRNPQGLPHPYFHMRTLFTQEQVGALMKDQRGTEADTGWRTRIEESAERAGGLDDFSGVSYLETRTYLANTLLRDTDAVSMASSLEIRVPLLDHKLVEFVAGLPARLKRRRGLSKSLLVDALADVLPAGVVNQPKRTFTLPWEHWLRNSLGETVKDSLANLAPSLREVLDERQTGKIWESFLDGRTTWARPWSLHVLNQWAGRHIDGG